MSSPSGMPPSPSGMPGMPIVPTMPSLPKMTAVGGSRQTRKIITPIHTTRKNLRNRR